MGKLFVDIAGAGVSDVAIVLFFLELDEFIGA